MNICRPQPTAFCHAQRIAHMVAATLCTFGMTPEAKAFSEANSNNATVQFEVVVPTVVGVQIAPDGRVKLISNSGQVLATQKAASRRRGFAEASDPPDYSSEIDIQTFDIDREFRVNPTLRPAARTTLASNEATSSVLLSRASTTTHSRALSGGTAPASPITFSAP